MLASNLSGTKGVRGTKREHFRNLPRDGATKTGSMWNIRFFILLSIFDRRWDPIGQYHSVNIPLGVPELVCLGARTTFLIDTLPVCI